MTTNILSFDVGVKHFGYALFSVPTRDVLQWGTCDMPLSSSSYLCATKQLSQLFTQPYDYVVIERQLHSKNIQTSRLEATLEGFFGAGGATVVLMPAGKKLTQHGLQLPQKITQRIADREAAAQARHKKACPTSHTAISKQQQTRLNKRLAMDLCEVFLEQNKQSATVDRIFKRAAKKDDLADALLQAITFVNNHLK